MATVTNDTNVANSALDALYNPNEAARIAPQKSLGQEDFLKLLTVQMQNQDPTNPVDNTKMIADMAQFSSLQAMQDLNKTVGSITQMMKMTQAMQASVMVGRSVVAPGSNLELVSGQQPYAALDLPETLTGVTVKITTANGTPVRELELGELPSGNSPVNWDGQDASGNQLPAGQYRIFAYGNNAEGARTSIGTLVANRVVSVDLANGSASLNLADGSSTSLNDIQQIR